MEVPLFIGRVPPQTIYLAASRLRPPTYKEGFGALYYVEIAEYSPPLAPVWQIKEVPHGE